MTQRSTGSTICFDATLSAIERWTIMRLPRDASEKLPSRGQVSVRGTINGHAFLAVLEPDGSGGHWLEVDRRLRRMARIRAGDAATVAIDVNREWPEPKLPKDFEIALEDAPQKILDLWEDITPMARWEWVRWVNATTNPDTRKRRVEVSISKMKGGRRRPCCFDLTSCTDPNLARNGRLVPG